MRVPDDESDGMGLRLLYAPARAEALGLRPGSAETFRSSNDPPFFGKALLRAGDWPF